MTRHTPFAAGRASAAADRRGRRETNPPPPRVWTPERDDELVALYTAPHRPPLRVIADAMGLTRFAVNARLGALRRAGRLSERRERRTQRPRLAAPPLTAELPTALAACATDVWPVDRLMPLCEGWRAGDSTLAIALRLRVPKNAVIGRAHRLIRLGILEPRPSPITQSSEPAPPAIEPPPPPKPRPWLTPVAPPLPGPPPTPPRTPERAYVGVGECSWPFGRPGSRSFRFCGAPTEPGRPYCADHVRIGFVRVAS